MNSDNNKYDTTFVTQFGKINPKEITCVYQKIEPEPRTLRWDMPTILEIEEDGVLHRYSIIEILDGLTRLAKRNKHS